MSNKSHFDIIFVVLVYRNITDIKDFFRSLYIANSKVVVVNSYFDDESERELREIAELNHADFLSVPNNGYGFGNNKGCEFALKHYCFKYLIISNADIMIEKLDTDGLAKYNDVIIAPEIINLSGKRQNPSSPFMPSRFREYIKFLLYKWNCRRLMWGLYAYSRLTKICFYLVCGMKRRIFSAHGAFVIFPFNVVKRLYPFYNEDMFLFNEEEHLGRLARQNGIDTVYAQEIIVRHKEDGSMKIASINEFQMLRQSFEVYYDFWKDSF